MEVTQLRHGISRLPEVEGEVTTKRTFKPYPIGFVYIDITEVRTKEGRLYLFVAIDRTTKFAFAALHEKADRPTAVTFLEVLLAAVPYRLHTILTDNGIQFADLPKNRDGWTARFRVHRFDQICREHGIKHRLTKPNHPWTNGQVKRMNRTIKEATVKRFHYDSHDQLRRHLTDFVIAYKLARRLKRLRGLTPYEAICKAWTAEPDRFRLDPLHQMSGLNTLNCAIYANVSNVPIENIALPPVSRLTYTTGAIAIAKQITEFGSRDDMLLCDRYERHSLFPEHARSGRHRL